MMKFLNTFNSGSAATSTNRRTNATASRRTSTNRAPTGGGLNIASRLGNAARGGVRGAFGARPGGRLAGALRGAASGFLRNR